MQDRDRCRSPDAEHWPAAMVVRQRTRTRLLRRKHHRTQMFIIIVILCDQRQHGRGWQFQWRDWARDARGRSRIADESRDKAVSKGLLQVAQHRRR